MSALLQEIVSVYPLLAPSGLTAHASNRVCNALALLQCVASHPETRGMFLNGMHPFLSWFSSRVRLTTESYVRYPGLFTHSLLPFHYSLSPHSLVLVSFPQHDKQD